jgi:hypothetical protein
LSSQNPQFCTAQLVILDAASDAQIGGSGAGAAGFRNHIPCPSWRHARKALAAVHRSDPRAASAHWPPWGWRRIEPGHVDLGMPEQPRDHRRAAVGAHQVGGVGVAQGAGRDLTASSAARLTDDTVDAAGRQALALGAYKQRRDPQAVDTCTRCSRQAVSTDRVCAPSGISRRMAALPAATRTCPERAVMETAGRCGQRRHAVSPTMRAIDMFAGAGSDATTEP